MADGEGNRAAWSAVWIGAAALLGTFGGLFLNIVLTGGSRVFIWPAIVLCLCVLVTLYLAFAVLAGWWPADRLRLGVPSHIPAERRPDRSGPISPHAAGTVPAAGSGPPKSAGQIPRAAKEFQPRQGLREKLDQAGSGGPVVTVLTGIYGVGKTQLAAQYAREKQAGGWRLVAWVNTEDQVSMRAGLTRVAEFLSLIGDGTDQAGYDAGEAVRCWLEADGERCLVVFDNASDPDLLQPYIPVTGAARVLITSSYRSMASLGDSLPVDVFTPPQAQKFLAARTGLDDSGGAATLACELGWLPLALAQAGAVIAGQHLTYQTYLDRLETSPTDRYLPREAGQPYQLGVADAIVLSLEAVKAAGQSALCTELLESMAVLSTGGVRRTMLHDVPKAAMPAADEPGTGMAVSRVDEALGQLAELSLLTFTTDDTTVVAHRLVMRVVRDGLIRQERLAAACQVAVSVLGTQAEALAGSWDRLAVRDLAEQVIALGRSATDTACAGDAGLAESLLRLRLRALSALNALYDNEPQAITIGEPLAVDYERVRGPEHPDTLQARQALANAYLSAGRASDAIAPLEQVLAARERTLGQADIDTLSARGNLADAYQLAGLAEAAIAVYEQLLGPFEQELGPRHQDTLKLRSNLARCYEDTGRTAEAIALFEPTLAEQQQVLGPDHPDTLATLSNLANCYREADRAAEAIPLHEQILAIRKHMLPPDHPAVLASRSNLANAYLEAKRTAEAIALFEQTLADQERVLGPDHPDTLASRSNLAIAYQSVGRTAEAIALFEQTLAARERTQGLDNPQTLASKTNLAIAYGRTGRIDDAILLFEQVLATQERLLGPDHRQTRTARSNLAYARQLARGNRLRFWVVRRVTALQQSWYDRGQKTRA